MVIDADFDIGTDGFAYLDDAFRATSEPAYASGVRVAFGGVSGGGLQVSLGGVDEVDITDMSGGWEASFALGAAEELELTFTYQLTLSGDYESSEFGQVMASVDGTLVGSSTNDFVLQAEGNGNGGPSTGSGGWVTVTLKVGMQAVGPHTLRIGACNNGKTSTSEALDVVIDDVRLETATPPLIDSSVQALVDELDPNAFRQNVTTLAAFGTRYWSQQGNADALDWIEAQLASYGYTVERHVYSFSGQTRENVYATKIGATNPDEMYIVSGHMDSFNTQSSGGAFAPGADDDASGTSLVLEAARVFAPPAVQTQTSIRFVLWNNEETGLNGSAAYVADKSAAQGIESPPGSGLYPEPTWRGVLQHDMIMFDHGLPVQPNQIPGADIDIEYQGSATFGGAAIALASAVLGANEAYATDYPAEVSANMNNTDSKSFQNACPAISLRENRRIAEIGQGANPNWHKNSDVIATYSDDDFLLGFNVLQTTVAAVGTLAGASVAAAVPALGPRAWLGLVAALAGLWLWRRARA